MKHGRRGIEQLKLWNLKNRNMKNGKIVITKNEILACIAYCAIKQSPYTIPQNLEKALLDAEKYIDSKDIFETTEKKKSKSYKEIDESLLYGIIEDICYNVTEITKWNITKWELDMGITDWRSDARKVRFSTTFCGEDDNGNLHMNYTEADSDFIDIDALVRNVTNKID